MNKLITIALRDFAVPAPRTGSIESSSGYGRQAAEGREIHLRIQKQRAKSDSLYQAEVSVNSLFERDRFQFRIDGRMDGLFRHETPRIEEIKSSFNIRELAHRLECAPFNHPYCLQLLTYGYFYWREHRIVPALSFHLVSSRNNDSIDVPLTLDISLYEQWLDVRLDELVVEAGQAEKRAARRRKAASGLTFPFAHPRAGQIELMHTVEGFMKKSSPMLIQAPTGLGKTVGILYPVLKEALLRGQNVVYVTPKNSQHSVAEDAVSRFQEAGASIKSLSITAKNKICFKDEPLCNPDYCEYARDYYEKIHTHDLLEKMAKKRKLKTRTFLDLGRQYQVCPFELQLQSAHEADVVICDYNYVFAPRSALGRITEISVDQAGKPNLVIDEAHNLPARAMDYYSPSLSSILLEKMRDDIQKVPANFRREAEELLDACLRTLVSCQKTGSIKPVRIEPPVAAFLDQHARLCSFLSRYLDSSVEGKQQDMILRLCYYWAEFTESLDFVADPDRSEFFATYHPHATGGTVKITCCDASAMLQDCYKDYEQVAGFSATLKPFEFYVRLSGLDMRKVKTAEFESPFPPALRKLLIIPQISTSYKEREHNYPKIADAVHRITAVRRGNYFVFLPSFEFLERVIVLFRPAEGFTVLKQERGMKAAGVQEMIDGLRTRNMPTIVFAVQGGSFSEGVDYAGETVIGAFVVGPPLPMYDLEREQMREYYQKKYAAGFEYAYTIPAMAKAIQAAGRVIRSESDKGLVVLMDKRFLESAYSQSMPADWFDSDVTTLVSDSILGDVADFWERQSAGS